jgi:hypothetical protein
MQDRAGDTEYPRIFGRVPPSNSSNLDREPKISLRELVCGEKHGWPLSLPARGM